MTKEPTETEKGVRIYKCSVCGYVMRTEEIGKLPPNSGSGDNSGSGSGTDTPSQGTKQPFIKGKDGKIGWDVIRAEEEQAQEGSTINVDMNGSAVVPGDIFDSIRGRDITITFDMGSWKNGQRPQERNLIFFPPVSSSLRAAWRKWRSLRCTSSTIPRRGRFTANIKSPGRKINSLRHMGTR